MTALRPRRRWLVAAILFHGFVWMPLVAQVESALGSQQRKAATLVGIFYDLKQTQQRKPVERKPHHYESIVDEFIVAGLDEALLNRFFRAPLPLYTTQIAIPSMNADVAPAAFGVGDLVRPSNWIIHYKAQIAPPVDGTYRFVGNVDDLLVIAIDRKVVLVANWPGTDLPRVNWKPTSEPAGLPVAASQYAKYGDWMTLRAGVPVDLDIVLGERPGGKFSGVILYEKKGETYDLNRDGKVVLPLFQTAKLSMKEARYLTDRPVWKCFD
jgi:hypothetical protein